MEPRQLALQALLESNPEHKARLASAIPSRAAALSIALQRPTTALPLPGRPALPRLVAPVHVPGRSPHTREGLAALIHAVCHIEFNAINLALDAAWRFDGMPREFHLDWLRVAAEEAAHFTMLREQLRALDHDYGDFDAHDGLWSMCAKTSGSVTARMALVPRTLEARGLDATPPMQERLRKAGTPEALSFRAALDVILRDEIGHVAIGNHWYAWCCAQDGIADPEAHFEQLSADYGAPRMKGWLNVEARRKAGLPA